MTIQGPTPESHHLPITLASISPQVGLSSSSSEFKTYAKFYAAATRREFTRVHPDDSGDSHETLDRKKLWQGCGNNPDFTVKTDIIDNSQLNEISNSRVCNASRLHPAYR